MDPGLEPKLRHVTIVLRRPYWLWKAIAYPIHAAHYLLWNGSLIVCKMLGQIVHKIMVADVTLRDMTEDDIEEFGAHPHFPKELKHESHVNVLEGYR